jgi:hypothetical protein
MGGKETARLYHRIIVGVMSIVENLLQKTVLECSATELKKVYLRERSSHRLVEKRRRDI